MTSPITNTRPGHIASVLADVVHRRRTGSWPSGKVPSWASEYAAQIGTKAGTAKFDETLDRWYVSQLEEALRPFAQAGAALSPRTDAAGTAVAIQGDDGKKLTVTYGQLRQAARMLGEGLRKLQDQAEIINRADLLDDRVLWQLRWMAYYADKPRWLLLRETPLNDGRCKLEALAYDGKVRSTVTFVPAADDGDLKVSLSRFGAVPMLKDAGRLDAIRSFTRTGDLKGRGTLEEAWSRRISDDARERRYRRRWAVVSDVHLNVAGVPGDRLIRLRWLDAPVRSSIITGDRSESDLVFRVGADGETKVLYGNEPWQPKPGEPRWRVASYVVEADNANKLLAGISAGSVRMIAEAVAGITDSAWIHQTEADRVLQAVQSEGGAS
ncbi:hypothetical protein [Magnetospirillum sp. 15-1]|uniref:hypothetical protein n=1 Tax=Magnetospirillum sp. 15-1 TaxID=1979370 RepID=UPI000BBBD2D0|nr:hypothetical protein [Magnetospirillum sp. 15-1]